MTRMAVLGTSQVSACGAGVEALREALHSGPGEPEWVPISKAEGAVSAPVLRARPEGLDEHVSPRAVRRLDDFAKNFIYATQLAIQDAGITMPAPERVAVVTGTALASLNTSFSLLDDIIFEGDHCGSPFKFTTAVNNASATSVAAFVDARGPCLSVLGFMDMSLNILRVASQWLEEDRADVIIVGAGDEFHPVIGYGLNHLGGWAEDGRMRPLDLDTCSYVPGETVAVMVLARPDFGGGGRSVIEGFSAFGHIARDYRPTLTTPQLLALDGRPATARHLRGLVEGGHIIGAYSPLWGGNPSAEVLNLVVGSMIVERGRFFAVPDTSGVPDEAEVADWDRPLDSDRLACVAANPDGSGSVITLTRSVEPVS